MSRRNASVVAPIALALLAGLASPSRASAQTLALGRAISTNLHADAAAGGTRTWISKSDGANQAGTVTAATFAWSARGCPGAVEIKFFRPTGTPPGLPYRFLTARGPFDVPAFPQTTTTFVSVRLEPPVAIEAGDLIAITNLTSCGTPMIAFPTGPLPGIFPLPDVVLPGDVRSDVISLAVGSGTFWTYAQATDVPVVSLLDGRFAATLTATNPRDGVVADGVPTVLDGTSGYFSLPGFTGSSGLPEITVKMVDARFAPPYPPAFWVYYSSLTDVQYTLTVTDVRTGRVRIYSSASGSPFCGGADTNAFPP